MEETDGAPDTLERVLGDVHGAFCFARGVRYQDRAHLYLRARRVSRGCDDTAMECAVGDMVRRAHAAGVREGRAMAAALACVPEPPARRGLRALLARLAGAGAAR